MPPSFDPENTTPGTIVSAPPMPPLQPRPLPHSFSAAFFDHTSWPVSSFTARIPPGFCATTPKYAFLSSAAAPHWPPRPLPWLDLYDQMTAPSRSGSKAYAMPDFD